MQMNFWSPKQAIQRIARLEKHFDFLWVEEPTPRRDFEGLRRISDAVRAPIATGENFTDPQEFVSLFQHGAGDVIQVASHNSGFTGAGIVADMAAAFDRPVVTGPDVGNSIAHLSSTWKHHVMMEVFEMGREAALGTIRWKLRMDVLCLIRLQVPESNLIRSIWQVMHHPLDQ
jgi:L-alanine-DL-glutamate epimerase-like enolase superfamily enzyme